MMKIIHQMGGEGFEPSKAVPADLQSVPFGHSGIHPYKIKLTITLAFQPRYYLIKSRQSESNQQPADYKSAALPLSHVGKLKPFVLFYDSKGIWTPDTTVKGWCLNRLTMEPKYLLKKIRMSVSYHEFILTAPRVGLEPTTTRLTAECSTIELSRITPEFLNSLFKGLLLQNCTLNISYTSVSCQVLSYFP